MLSLFLFSGVMVSYSENPDEGMWLPIFIERLNHVDMQKMGLHLTSEELYSINNSSVKDAVVGLSHSDQPTGFFCTGEVVSDEGLILTNHHCGFPSIQSHSTVEHNYINDGFWAMNKQEELANKGLTASFLIRMENVTSKIIPQLNDSMSDKKRKEIIGSIIKNLEKESSEGGKYNSVVKDFYAGNEYYLFVYQTYKDVRLVGTPPSSIGQFGGDTDNWMWPRHTGDFSIFRIYTAPDGSPAEYSEKNIPLKPKYFFPVSLKGVKRGDFSMVWGYPGSTTRYTTSYAIKFITEVRDPAIVKIRNNKLAIMKVYMNEDPDLEIKLVSTYNQISNYWKYYMGEIESLNKLNIYNERKTLEEDFQKWADADPARKSKYGNVLNGLELNYDQFKKVVLPSVYVNEAVWGGPQVISFIKDVYTDLSEAENKDEKEKAEIISKIKQYADEYFDSKNFQVNKDLFYSLCSIYYQDVEAKYQPPMFNNINKKCEGSFKSFTDAFFRKSIFTNKSSFYAFLQNPKLEKMKKDIGYQLMSSFLQISKGLTIDRNFYKGKIDSLSRLFVAGSIEMNQNKIYYPDANSTMRMTYGKVSDYFPSDAVHYDYYTTLDGIMEKENQGNKEFIVPQKLKDLYKNKDYGRYGTGDKMNVCFISDNDITGGNSGSPVLNGDGHLIGLAFDGNWESLSSSINYQPEIQRSICVDIRYVLFIIDKFAGARNIVDEMMIIE